MELVSCPTCGRCEIQLQELAEGWTANCGALNNRSKWPSWVVWLTVRGSQGCGYRDSRGRGFGLLFKGGQVIAKVENNRMASALIDAARETAKRREMVEDDTASSADSEGRAQ